MDYKELSNKLKEINIENMIWVLYIGIIILSYYSNYLEKKYFINKDIKSKDEYRKIIIIIFYILVIVYFYFLNDSYQGIKELNINDSKKKKDLVYLSFIASLLIFISGIIFLYIAIEDEELNVELAFN